MAGDDLSTLTAGADPSDDTGERARRSDGGSRLRRPVMATVAVLVVLVGWTAAETFFGFTRLPDDVTAAFDDGPTTDMTVSLDFQPERFHLDYFQSHGSVGRVEGSDIYLRGVTQESAREIAGEYWVAQIRPWDRN